jgi:hypothetical protein
MNRTKISPSRATKTLFLTVGFAGEFTHYTTGHCTAGCLARLPSVPSDERKAQNFGLYMACAEREGAAGSSDLNGGSTRTFLPLLWKIHEKMGGSRQLFLLQKKRV